MCFSDISRVILIRFQTKYFLEMGLNADINHVVGCYLCLKQIAINPSCAELFWPSIGFIIPHISFCTRWLLIALKEEVKGIDNAVVVDVLEYAIKRDNNGIMKLR